jgi:S-formylglutathione hydrolase FrmB
MDVRAGAGARYARPVPRRGLIGLVLGMALALPAPAVARRVVTWELHSGFVNPRTAALADPHQGSHSVHRPTLRVRILLPDGYDGHRRFPVLYLLHPHGSNADSWLDPGQGDIARLSRGLGAIIVMPDGGVNYYSDVWNGGSRNPAWERYEVEQLIPRVEHRLRIRAGRRWHALAGFSMGAYGAYYLAAQRPGYFGAAASLSGPLNLQRLEWPTAYNIDQSPWGMTYDDQWGDPQSNAFYWTGHNPTRLLANLRYTRLYAVHGDGIPHTQAELNDTVSALAEKEVGQQTDDFVSAARQAGLDVTFRLARGLHNWPSTRERYPGAQGWGFFRAVSERPSRWTYDTVERRAGAWGFRFGFAAAPATGETFSLDGRRLTGGGSGAVAVRAPGGRLLHLHVPFSIVLRRADLAAR